MKTRLIKLTPRAMEQLRNDPRVQVLHETMQERELNELEIIILKQLISEAEAGTL